MPSRPRGGVGVHLRRLSRGVGIAEKGFDLLRDLWRATYETVRDCRCQEGCPSCIQSLRCGCGNTPLDKRASVLILGELLKAT